MNQLFRRYPELAVCKEDIENAFYMLATTYKNGGKVLVCGNGGSAADAEHIVGELMKNFMIKRKTDSKFKAALKELGFTDAEYLSEHLEGALPAISLVSQSSILSAFANDNAADMVYAQLVYGYAEKNDLLWCLSTSGNSANVVNAAKVAKAKGIKVLSFTGKSESKLSGISDVTVRVPKSETFLVQELHLPVYHYLCANIEKAMFEE